MLKLNKQATYVSSTLICPVQMPYKSLKISVEDGFMYDYS